MGNTHEMRREEKAKFSYTARTFLLLFNYALISTLLRFHAGRQIVHMMENLYEKSGGKTKNFFALFNNCEPQKTYFRFSFTAECF